MPLDRNSMGVDDDRAEKHVTGSLSIQMPSGLTWFKPPKVGTIRLEFVPFLKGESHNRFVPEIRFSKPGKWYPERTYFSHRGVGVDNLQVCCPWKTFGKACPICEQRVALSKSAHALDKENADKLRPQEKQLFLVIVRGERSGELEGNIALWDVATNNFGKQLDLKIGAADPEDREDYKYYYHPNGGCTVKVNAVEETMGKGGQKYTKFFVDEFKRHKTLLPDDLFEHGYDLDAMVRDVSYDQLKKIFLGREDDDGDDNDDRGPPPPSTRQPERESAPTPVREPAPQPTRETVPNPAPRQQNTPIHREPEISTPNRTPPPVPPTTPKSTTTPLFGPFASRDMVEFLWRDERKSGMVQTVNDAHKTLVLTCDWRDKPVTIDFDEVLNWTQDSTFDKKSEPTPAPPKPKGRSWDDDTNDGDEDNRTYKPRTGAKK